MNFLSCPRESELAEQLACGHWPHASSADLLAHIDACPKCRDLLRVSNAMRDARNATASLARLQPPGVLWWRAELRRRRAALESLERPILAGQIFAAVLTLAAAAVFLATRATLAFGWLRWLEALPQALHFEELLPAMQGNEMTGAIAAVAVLAVIGCGAAAYAGLEKR